ncbi:exopolyphosphatase [Desulfonema magnum]|uniref:Phosphoesterase domain-containing protein n=1 Tax=Desulfonema magnum TaxID=45655 RepID=A0A975BER5_9BACT|nr:exopolyphosphatase [Desulfonema magnum]QTA84172.1 phosphoesterase domain-containing protein [Desulfonema magnum]
MRIVTRADFDSIVCAVLLYEALDINKPVKWVEPSEIQKGLADVEEGDILANLPYDKNCSMWFDHHYTNRIDTPFEGAFEIAPSAAGVIFKYYKDRFTRDYSELVRETDKIDSADLSLDEVLHPESYPSLLISMTISNRDKSDEAYWNKLIDLLRKFDIPEVFHDPEVKKRCKKVIEQNKAYETLLKEHTHVEKHVSVTDFRSLDEAPVGNRFLVYSLFPETIVNMKIRYDNEDREKVIIGVGHSIFNPNCKVNVGLMLSNFEGGGHRGAGACNFHKSKTDKNIRELLDILLENKANEE